MAKRAVQVYQIDVFTSRMFAGNPAGVVLGAECLAESEMQSLARELNNSDSAFVLPPDGPDHEVRLRFFTPTREVGFVGHASVAAHVARLAAGRGTAGKPGRKARTGICEVEVAGSSAAPRVSVAFPAPQFEPAIDAATRTRLLDVFGIDTATLDPNTP